MYRCIFRLPPKSSLNLYESRLLAAKCDIAAVPVFRSANAFGAKSLSTSSFRLCEKKDDVALSAQDEKTNAEKQVEPTETPTLSKEKAADDSKVSAVVKEREEPLVLNTDGGGANRDTDAVAAAKPVPKPKGDAKSGKQSLLNLLGSMKVDVTNKRMLKKVKEKQSNKFTSKPKQVPMESTISMFQKAKKEGSPLSEYLDPELVAAASAAAATLPTHTHTESQLLKQLQKQESVTEAQKKGDANKLGEHLDPELVAAASAAAATLPTHTHAESELLKQLQKQQSVTEAQKKGDANKLGSIITNMRVSVSKTLGAVNLMSSQIRFDEDGKGYTRDKISAKMMNPMRKPILGYSRRLEIFSPETYEDSTDSAVERPTLWDVDFAHQLTAATNLTPRNPFEEMIDWTKEGKLWQYPINNEACLEEEANVPFYEHVFLGKHLEEGFPRRGPVRHFMELVIGGLSKNPHLTIQQKKEHIQWFRDYFQQKKNVLMEAEVSLN